MKNLFILFLTIILVSCGNEDDISKIESTISSEFSPEKFVGSTIAHKLNDEIKLGIIEKELITSFNNYSKKMELGKKALSYEIFKIEENRYIRFYNEEGAASTVAFTK
ncbi:MAG: argonaute-like protein implicated in RNA metabolism and viral defense [Urechidicola sp.]|jgi:argonaute-like protein implicated in RNA metabolism and viral defense